MSKATHATPKTAALSAFALLGPALLALVLLLPAATLAHERAQGETVESMESVIVKAESVEKAIEQVREVDGKVTHKLGIIKAVAANVTTKQRAELEAMKGGIRIHANHTATLDGKPGAGGHKHLVVETYYPTHLGADLLHSEGIDGSGVTIAVLDSGIFTDNGLTSNPGGSNRILARPAVRPMPMSSAASTGW